MKDTGNFQWVFCLVLLSIKKIMVWLKSTRDKAIIRTCQFQKLTLQLYWGEGGGGGDGEKSFELRNVLSLKKPLSKKSRAHASGTYGTARGWECDGRGEEVAVCSLQLDWLKQLTFTFKLSFLAFILSGSRLAQRIRHCFRFSPMTLPTKWLIGHLVHIYTLCQISLPFYHFCLGLCSSTCGCQRIFRNPLLKVEI